MAKHNGDAQWMEIDPNTLSDKAKAHYERYKALYRQAKEARTAFEAEMNAQDIPEGMRMIFGYNFGKLSVALVEGEAKAKPQAKKAQSLASWLASQR